MGLINKANQAELRKIYLQQVKLVVKYVEDKVKDNEALSAEEVNEAIELLSENLKKLQD